MAEWLDLPEVAAREGLASRAIARRGGELILRPRFLADVRAWRAALAPLAGDRALLYFDDSYDFACALFGAWHAGKEACLPGDAQPATLQRLLAEVPACAGDLPSAVRPVATMQTAPLDRLDLRQTRLVVYTSGSSGEPLAIPKRLAQLDAEMHTLQAAFGRRIDALGAATVHATVSHQHIYGLLFHTLWSLAAGRVFAAERIAYPEQMAERLGSGPSVLVSSPAHLKRLPDSLDWAAARGGLQAVFSSGGPLPPEASQSALELLGHSPIEVFGSSETGGIAWRQRAVDGDRWTAFDSVDWRLDGDLLCVRSRHLPDEDWAATADRARALAEGGFILLGRADRIVKIEEKRVSITALEQLLHAGPEVAEARVIVLTDETTGAARLGVVAVPSALGWTLLQNQGKRALDERLRALLLQSVERVALPKRWRYVHGMPSNAQGKATEALLAELFRPQRPEPTWISRETNQAELELDITPALAAFDGHFPEMPILPGVVQVDWAVQFARQCFPLPQRFLRAETLKFQRPVRPGLRLTLALGWKLDGRVLRFVYRSAAGTHASGNLVFEADDA